MTGHGDDPTAAHDLGAEVDGKQAEAKPEADADADDEALLDELRGALSASDPVPAAVREAARAAIIMGRLDGELALLVADSAQPVGFDAVRADEDGPEAHRFLSFAGAGVQVDLEVTGRGPRADVVGQLTGAAGPDCVVESVDGARRLELDELGRFVAGAVPRGPVRLRCASGAGLSVVTAWVTV
jgi:hypothetical protein